MKKIYILAAILSIGVSASASAQFQVFDQGIIRQAAECASMGNCHLNNMEMNNNRGENLNEVQDRFAREDAERERHQKQRDEENQAYYGQKSVHTKQDYERALKSTAVNTGKDKKPAKQPAKAVTKAAP